MCLFCYSAAIQRYQRIIMHDLIDQLIPPQFQGLRNLIHQLLYEDPEFYYLLLRMFFLEQMCLVEPCAVKVMPTTHIQGAGVMLTLWDRSDPDLEKFSKTYDMPYHFSPLPHGLPTTHTVKENLINPYSVSLFAWLLVYTVLLLDVHKTG